MSCRKTRQQKEEGMANFYELADLISQKAVQELPKILDDMGYAVKCYTNVVTVVANKI